MFRPPFRPAPAALAVALACGHLAVHAQSAPTPTVAVSISAQPLAQALNDWARQTGLELMVQPALVAGKTASAVSGRLTPQQSLDRLLAGSGLTGEISGTAAVVRKAETPKAASPAQTQLGDVEVSSDAETIGGLQKTYSGGQLARGGDLGILGRTDLMDVPFSTTNYTSELIENQQGLTISDVVMNDASVRTLQARGGYGDDFQVRGFQINNRDVSMNGLYGLVPSTRVPLEMIERVEVLKGPGSLTNGVGPNGSVGGSLNVVTKRASDVPLTRLTTTYMGKAQFGTHLDVGRRFGDENQWGIRANGVWRNGEGNIDGGRQRLGLGSLGVDYAGTRLRWSADLLYSSGKTTNFRPQSAFLAGITELPAVPDSRKSYYPGAELTEKAKTAITRLEYDITTTSRRTAAWVTAMYRATRTSRPRPRGSTRREISRSRMATTTNTTRRLRPTPASAHASRPAR